MTSETLGEPKLTIITKEGDVEIITDGDEPQSVSHKVSQEPVVVYPDNIWNKQTELIKVKQKHVSVRFSVTQDSNSRLMKKSCRK